MNVRATMLLGSCALALAAPAHATTVVDPAGDFLATFGGAQSADIDIVSATALFDGTSFRLSSRQAGAIGSSTGSLFVWGVNRGAGTPRLTFGSPAIGASVLFDAVAVFLPDGSGRVAAFPAMGAPVITPLAPGSVTISGNTISGIVPLSLLPSTGFTTQSYTFTLWSRLRVNPLQDGTNAEIADFAPNQGGILAGAVPEPTTWAMMIMGFGLVGGAMRVRRRTIVFAQ